MAGGGCVQYGNVSPIVQGLQYRGHQKARIQRHRLPGLQIYCQSVLLLHPSDTPLKTGNVIIRSGYMMSSTEVYPLHPRQICTELLFHRIQSLLQVVGILFTECMKMQTIQTRQYIRRYSILPGIRPDPEILRRHPQP